MRVRRIINEAVVWICEKFSKKIIAEVYPWYDWSCLIRLIRDWAEVSAPSYTRSFCEGGENIKKELFELKEMCDTILDEVDYIGNKDKADKELSEMLEHIRKNLRSWWD